MDAESKCVFKKKQAEKHCCYEPSSRLQLMATLRVSDLQNVLSLTNLLNLYKLKAVASLVESAHLVLGLPHFPLSSSFLHVVVFPCISHLLISVPNV